MTDEGAENAPKLPKTTVPLSFKVSLKGFADAGRAEAFGALLSDAIRTIGRAIDLERLDGVTVAFDYEAALTELDRGFDSSFPLVRTQDEHNIGVAMAPAVMRNGVVKAHMVFSAPVVLALEDETSEGHRLAVYLVAHECAHVEDLKHRDESFPGTILQQCVEDAERAILEPVASAIWCEYAACRASAIFGEDHLSVLVTSLMGVLPAAPTRIADAIRAYRLHGDIERVLREAGEPLCAPVRSASYVLGHLDGIEEELEGLEELRDQLEGSGYLSSVLQMRGLLRDLWSRRGSWESPDEFSPVYDLVRDLYTQGGMVMEKRADGTLYVHIPMTPENMP